ncbi:hypothetical protein AWM70_12665 [Paenibacillus yonginensis]|uniref:GGDEF domain-containing protein n=1 Tax=Paenibacillus yonginensis TaxID=1462996 RepID=A0A1B1N1S2_9BACL|nr:hypothetical protein [Paenibacillus yonginensis]ANS75356.1 hypothetical protein AWM70_12665 [Paenibacillus yonginensis]
MDRFQAWQDGFLIAICLVLLSMGATMYFKWRTQTYLNFSGASLLGLFASLGMALSAGRSEQFFLFFSSLFLCGFVLQQISVFRLYYPKRNEKLYPHLAAGLASMLTAACSLFLPGAMTALLLFFIILALGLYSFLKLFTEGSLKALNSIAVALYGIHMLSLIVWAVTKAQAVVLFGNLFFIGSVFLVFMLLFNRIAYILQAAAYTSTRDDATGLLTKKHFMQTANKYMDKSQAHAVLYIEVAESTDKPELLQNEKFLRNLGEIVRKYTSEIGITSRFTSTGFVVLVTKEGTEPGDLAERIRLRLELEAQGGVYTGYMAIWGKSNLEDVIEEARKAAERNRITGMDKVFRLEQSRVLTDRGVGN